MENQNHVARYDGKCKWLLVVPLLWSYDLRLPTSGFSFCSPTRLLFFIQQLLLVAEIQ
jgi:hypothetical protein